MRDEVVEPKVVVERVQPEVGLQVRARQHGSESIADCLVRSLAWSVLV